MFKVPCQPRVPRKSRAKGKKQAPAWRPSAISLAKYVDCSVSRSRCVLHSLSSQYTEKSVKLSPSLNCTDLQVRQLLGAPRCECFTRCLLQNRFISGSGSVFSHPRPYV